VKDERKQRGIRYQLGIMISKYLGQVFKLERRFTTLATGKVEIEVQYGLTSLTREKAHPERLLSIVRSG
jgi:hypothetical protein